MNLRRGSSRSSSKASTTSAPRHPRRTSSKSTTRSSISSLAPSVHSVNTNVSTPRSSVGYASSLSDLPEDIAEYEAFGHTHWCPECDKYINTCDGWKRHMKEHESYYTCLPSGPVENSENDPTCAFCCISSPDQFHLASHRAAQCFNNPRGPTKKSRKSLMVNHLAEHGILDQAASDLADKWHFSRNKRAFACGFCVKGFLSITEQLNHIHTEHYRHGLDKSGWNVNTVIKGLLRQPKVHKHWQRLLATDTPLSESLFRWDPPAAKDLQAKLETGEESGADLALTAFGSSIYGFESMSSNVQTSVTVPILQHMAAPALLSNPHEITQTQSSFSDSSSNSSFAKKPPAAVVSRYQTDLPSWTDVSDVQSSVQDLDHPQDQQGLFQIPSSAVYYDSGSVWQQGSLFGEAVATYHMQPPLSSLPTKSPSPSSGSQPDQHARLNGHLDNNGDLMTVEVSYPSYEIAAATESNHAIDHIEYAPIDDLEHTIKRTASAIRSTNNIASKHDINRKVCEKPLPELPASNTDVRKHSPETRPRSLMDIDFG